MEIEDRPDMPQDIVYMVAGRTRATLDGCVVEKP